jgi:transcriptional regulator with XRE-family HTH domain
VNSGTVILAGIIKRRDVTQREIALESELDEGKLSRILSGKAVPNLTEAIKLRDKYGIDPAEWKKPTGREQAKGAA